MIYGCSQPRELWFIDFNHVTMDNTHMYMYMYIHVRIIHGDKEHSGKSK